MKIAFFRLSSMTAVALVLFLGSSCAELKARKLEASDNLLKNEVAYCLLVPRIRLVEKDIIVYDNNPENTTKSYEKAARRITSITGSIVQVPTPDYFYGAQLDGGWFTSDQHKIEYEQHGCLKSYNFTASDQTGSVVSTVAGIVLAAAAFAVVDQPEPLKVKDPDPLPSTYLIHQQSAKLLSKAEKKISVLLKKQRNQAEETKLESLIEKVAKLRDLLNPQPNRISKIVYEDLYFAEEGNSADEQVIKLVESRTMGTVFADGSFILAVARRIK